MTELNDQIQSQPIVDETAPLNVQAPVTDVHVPQHAEPKKNTGKTFLAGFAGAAVACVLAFGISGTYNAVTASHQTTGTGTPASQVVLGNQNAAAVTATDDNATLAEQVAAKCLPSVVSVDVYVDSSNVASMYGYSGNVTGNSQGLVEASLGSGVVLTSDGYIITNNHVIEGGDAYKVTIEGTTYDATLVGADPSSDIAVLKAENASNLTPMEIGDSDNLTIGEWVMTLGNPFGLNESVATGIVSATSRSQVMNSSTTGGDTTIYPNMIQTDAAINPGNSGGALVDADGRLIGINTLITSYSGNYSGVGFAIPVNYAVNLAQDIINGEEPTHAQLGVSTSTVSQAVAERYGLAVDTGAYVAEVSPGSSAEQAGIQVGDIIVDFDGTKVASSSDLMLDVRTKRPGDVVDVTINRDGQEQTLQVTLGTAKDTVTNNDQNQGEQGQVDPYSQPYGGNQYGYGDGYGYGYGDGNGYGYGFGW